ncbi:MAG: ankyrin repeat domain-containing protein [Zoogloea sp.]|nr:ankyrin repeat domain-containing protein [Zoogloea sp.]
MAHLPSFEEILTEVHSRLGLKALPNKGRFTSYELEVDGHGDRVRQLLQDIYDALELDGRAQQDATHVIEKLAGILKALELRTWTGNASQHQVLWHLLAYVHVPIWARNVAFWSLANIEHDLPPIDAGMPGGAFWFLPTGNPQTGEIDLPIPKVLAWLLNLLNESTVGKLRDAVGNRQLREKEGGNEAAVRTLRNWQAGKELPKSDNKIVEIFPDDAALTFAGAFLLDIEWSPETQFEKALEFVVERRALNIEQLSAEISMTPERLHSIFNKTADAKKKAAFVRHVSIRYTAPSMATIRQRLRVARLVQAGYQDLAKFLCPELQPEEAHDPRKNKVLQLVALFETIYNKTIQAWHHGNSEAEQDAWFEQQFLPLDRYDLLLPILPTLPWEQRVPLLAERLTRRFMALEPGHGLEDILPSSANDLEVVLRRRIERIRNELEEDKRVEMLCQRVKAASPYRTLQAESSFWVLSQFSQSKGLSEKVRQMAWKRMAEVAASPLERGTSRLLNLGHLLNGEVSAWPEAIRQEVQQQLDATETDEAAWEQWKAPLLRLKAKHALYENRFDDAETLFKAALAACSERAFGDLRGEIARDGFALAIFRSALNRKNHEPYYRNMLHFMEFPNGVPSFEDAAAECEEYFWSTLYRPYPGLEAVEGAAKVNIRAATEEAFGLIESGDWDGFKAWLTKNKKAFHDSDLKDARRNSVLMSSLKWLYELEDKLPMLRMMAPAEIQGGLFKVEQHLRNRRQSIRLLLEAWPKQAAIADFKGQTPLMMASNHGDRELVPLLLPLSEVDAQDYIGRTPLHAAVAGRCPDCLSALLALNPDVAKVTLGEANTVAHTAVRFGWVEGLRLLLNEFPGLAGAKNHLGQTAVEMAQELLENYEAWRTFMREHQGHGIGAKGDFEAIVALLEERCLH